MKRDAEEDDADETTIEEQTVMMMRRLLIAMANDEIFLTSTALLLKRLHETLMKVGFSEEQATQIVCHYRSQGDEFVLQKP